MTEHFRPELFDDSVYKAIGELLRETIVNFESISNVQYHLLSSAQVTEHFFQQGVNILKKEEEIR
jgi:hypothetical protein